MTENEAKQCIEQLKLYNLNGELTTPVNNDVSMLWDGAFGIILDLFEEIQTYRAIGTVEELKALKEKNTPMELAEHSFQDEVHHYLCPSCRSIVSCNQKYCEECGQALET